ncbi:cytochrome p450 [Hirsutella rhossiliensis]|uniref:Cytochrome p450 domain-containing protein n=1 Tax=Hirsutella rhossiliensis TaxID=111463 RepID=A0A9P8SN60_9HYPO|nr:cytochrome p450 domain-containing protein [Hirsutella rhossiliensis]KAH0967535.1 cytochrome p450 domain-containing protein [Hirsutella rhossiliensis]
MALFTLAVVWLVAVALLSALQRRFQTYIPVYQGKGSLAFLSVAQDFATKPIGLIQKATEQCGNVFSIRVLSVYNVWLRGNELNKIYLDTREDVWSFKAGMGLFLNKIVDPGFWEHYRVLLSSLSKYVSGGAAQEHAAVVSVEETRKAAAKWATERDFELFDTVSLLVHKITVRSLMGEDFYEHNAHELFQLLHAMEADIGSILSFVLPDWIPHPPARRLRKARERFKEIFLERLHERSLAGAEMARPKQDYVAFTMQDKATAPLKYLMASHHTILMFAAHTSTAANIAWNIIALLRHPDIMNKVSEELRSEPEGNESLLLQACVKETTRYYCGIKLLRLACRDMSIPEANVKVPKGAVVSISPYLTHRDPENYANPEAWDPQRWIGEDGEIKQVENKSNGVKFMPFGGGSHRCVGEKMAIIMVTKAVATLVREYDWGWASPDVPDKTDFESLDFGKVGTPWLRGDVRVRVKKACLTTATWRV